MSHFRPGQKVKQGYQTIHVVKAEDMGAFFGTLLIGIDVDTGKVASAQADKVVHVDQDCDWCYPKADQR